MAKGVRFSAAELRAAGFSVRGVRATRDLNEAAAASADWIKRDVDQQIMRGLLAGQKESKLEQRFSQQLTVRQLPPHQRNYFFLEDRDLELDFAWPAPLVAVEIQGGAHRASAQMLARDCEKLCLAQLAGWVVLPLDSKLVRSGRGLELLMAVLMERERRG